MHDLRCNWVEITCPEKENADEAKEFVGVLLEEYSSDILNQEIHE